MKPADIQALQRLSDILDLLRRQCPWDRVQTMQSLRYLTIEETFELSEAILKLASGSITDEKKNAELKKELGDLFMHLLFYAKIAEEEGRFTPADIFNAIRDKLVDRHPFIFHPDDYDGESWEQIKMHEGRKSVLEGVPASLPSLVKAVRLQEKAAGIGVDPTLPSPDGSASTPEVPPTQTMAESEPTEESFGTLLFNLIHWAHDHGINADTALSRANQRFCDKVKAFEQQ
jgi:XTP/dITP diphosphohydrolase